jgi:hypothetical protein
MYLDRRKRRRLNLRLGRSWFGPVSTAVEDR